MQEYITKVMLRAVLILLGPILFICMQLAAMWTARTISVTKRVGDLSIVPFASLLVNCIVWTFYGYIEGHMAVVVPNFFGIFAGLYCTYTYHLHSPSQVCVSCVLCPVACVLYLSLLHALSLTSLPPLPASCCRISLLYSR